MERGLASPSQLGAAISDTASGTSPPGLASRLRSRSRGAVATKAVASSASAAPANGARPKSREAASTAASGTMAARSTGSTASAAPPSLDRPAASPSFAEALQQEGYMLVRGEEGSRHPLGIRARLDTGFCFCCDMQLPPLSGSTADRVVPGRTLLVSVLAAAAAKVVAEIDGEVFNLSHGDNVIIKPGAMYSLRNTSAGQVARVKMVNISPPAAATTAPAAATAAPTLPRAHSHSHARGHSAGRAVRVS